MLVTLDLAPGCSECASLNGTYELTRFENVDFCDWALDCISIEPIELCGVSVSGISMLLRLICQENPTLNYFELRLAYFRTAYGGCGSIQLPKIDFFRNDFGESIPDCFAFEDVQLDYVEPLVPAWCLGSAYISSP